MSSSVGLWLSSIRSVSPRVPTVEYARSERSSAKSSQAARNSALSVARSSADRRRQAGSSLKNVNLTNVRPATRRRLMAVVLAAGVLWCAWAPLAEAKPPTVTIALVPRTTLVQRLADEGFSVGLLSAGIGDVSAEQTYRDISAGNREPPPSDAVPGLLGLTLSRAGFSGTLRRIHAAPDELSGLVAQLHGEDLLIALGKPPPPDNRALPVGIAGAGFDGTLTSDSTRTRGYVLSTDLAPTILRRLGVSIPDQMDGEPIR